MRFFPHCIQKQAVNIDHFCSGWAQEQKSQMRDEKINQGVNVMPLASIISSYKHTLGCMRACWQAYLTAQFHTSFTTKGKHTNERTLENILVSLIRHTTLSSPKCQMYLIQNVNFLHQTIWTFLLCFRVLLKRVKWIYCGLNNCTKGLLTSRFAFTRRNLVYISVRLCSLPL